MNEEFRDLEDLKDVVLERRRLSGLSRVRLAKLAGVGKTAIYDLEHGKESIQLDTLKKVLDALNIRIRIVCPGRGRAAGK